MSNEANNQEIVYMTAADFLEGAQECSVVEELFQQLDEEASKTILDDAELRRREDWSILASQVVGGEHIPTRQ